MNVPVLQEVAGGAALIVVTILLAAFTIVFGELVPKTLALAHTDRFAIVLAGPVDLLGRILGPVVSRPDLADASHRRRFRRRRARSGPRSAPRS